MRYTWGMNPNVTPNQEVTMTLDEAYEYVDQAIESESEQRAEYGSGAVSMGYDPHEWSAAYEGYRTAEDPEFQRAQALIKAHEAERRQQWAADNPDLVALFAVPASDDIPF